MSGQGASRLGRLVGAVALALALLASAIPARAGDLRVEDPAGDANGFDVTGDRELESTPRPSDAELDILGLTWFSDAKELRLSLKLAEIAHPVGSAGFSYRLNFTHDGRNYHFLYQVFGPPESQFVDFFFRRDNTVINCRCSGKVNGKTATLEVTAELASLGKAVKADGAAPIRPGTKITGISGSTDRILGFLVAVDQVHAPDGTAFTV